MPEVAVAERMRDAGAGDSDVRLMLTFTAAMDRAREADRLWFAASRLYEEAPWAFRPDDVVARGIVELADVLRLGGLTQRHGPDSGAWRTIAEALVAETAPAVSAAVIDGRGDARELLEAVRAASPAGTPLFPMLRGPKIGPMWVRMLAHPGGAEIRSLDALPVAVDVQVRKVSEYLGMTDTGPLDLEAARSIIQGAWAADVREHGAAGPAAIDGTAAALDPALWFFAKWGCTRCEQARRRMPVSRICSRCRYPLRGGE
jgi:hypothetical protein